MAYLLMIHVVGLAGGMLAKKRRLPGGALVGAMACVVLISLIVPIERFYPTDLRVIVQVFSGAIIGLNFRREDMAILRYIFKSALIMVSMLLGLNLMFGLAIGWVTDLDPITALFAIAPGGLADMALIASDFGADPQPVIILQVFRFAFVVSFFPLYVRRLLNRMNKESEESGSSGFAPKQAGAAPVPTPFTLQRAKMMAITVLTAGAGAFVARGVGIPAGAIIGAISATVVLNIVSKKGWFPKSAKAVVQTFAGSYLGSQITIEAIASLRYLLVPMILVIIQVLVMAFATSWVLSRCTPMDRVTALFSSVPGGISEMGMIAEEMGLRVPDIILMHTCRLIVIISVLPQLIYIFTLLFR